MRKPRHTSLTLSPEVAALHEAARNGDEIGVLNLLLEGADPNAATPWGSTALHAAAFANRPEAIQLLIEAGADTNARLESEEPFPGYTPLHCTTEWDSIEAAHALIQFGADIEAQSTRGETPLRVAVETSGTYAVVSPGIALLLIRSGADVNAVNNRGESILEEVSKAVALSPHHGPSREIFNLLLKRTARRRE